MNALPLSIALEPVPPVSEDLHLYAARHLRPEEIGLLSPRSSQKRRAEFTAGRIAARTAVARLLEALPSSCTFVILREGAGPTGRPIVSWTCDGAVPHVSISHTDGLAVAAASFGRVGIDLASIQVQEQSFVDETFSPCELDEWAEWLRSERTSALTVTTAFAAKEAALKWLGTGFALPLRAIEVLPRGVGVGEHPSSFPVPTLHFPVSLSECGRQHLSSLSGRFASIDDRVSIVMIDETSH